MLRSFVLKIGQGFLFLGLSLDFDPEWTGWIVLEGICAWVFVAEVVVKSYAPGVQTVLLSS